MSFRDLITGSSKKAKAMYILSCFLDTVGTRHGIKGYMIHRNLVQLKNAGILNNVKAMIFADFTNGDEYIEQSIKNFCVNHIPNIDAYKALGVGHGQINQPIIRHYEASIKNNYLSFDNPFCLINDLDGLE